VSPKQSDKTDVVLTEGISLDMSKFNLTGAIFNGTVIKGDHTNVTIVKNWNTSPIPTPAPIHHHPKSQSSDNGLVVTQIGGASTNQSTSYHHHSGGRR
jgi:hypothetical protein